MRSKTSLIESTDPTDPTDPIKLGAGGNMKVIEQIIELITGHSEILTNARKSLDQALEENRKATDRLRGLVDAEAAKKNGSEKNDNAQSD